MAHIKLPRERIANQEFAWRDLRPNFFEGFHRCVPALAAAGNNLIVEHIVETEAWMSRLLQLLRPFDVFFVGVHCPLPELERREIERATGELGKRELTLKPPIPSAVMILRCSLPCLWMKTSALSLRPGKTANAPVLLRRWHSIWSKKFK